MRSPKALFPLGFGSLASLLAEWVPLENVLEVRYY